MTLVAVAGWGGRKVYQRATMHRLITEATQFIADHNLHEASLCLRRALSINSADVSVNRLMADMLEEGGSPQALDWRIRTAQLETNNVENRFAWARTALRANNLPSMAQALRGVDEKSKSTAEFHTLRGALAMKLRLPQEAEKEYTEALLLQPTNQVIALDLDTIGLISTNPETAQQARVKLENIPTNSPLRLAAARCLVDDAAAHRSFERARVFSYEIVINPKSTYSDKLTYLQLLKATKNPGMGTCLAALEAEGAHSAGHAYVLSHWMAAEESPAEAMKWLESLPAETQTNLSVTLAKTDCEIAMKDWKGLIATVQNQNWEEFNYYRLCLESLATRNLNNSTLSQSDWQRAVYMASTRLDRMVKLDQLTAAWGWTKERADVLQQVCTLFPKEAWAGEELTGIYHSQGDTHALANLLNKLYAADPSNTLLKNNLATVLMLLKSDPPKAQRLALECYSSSTNNPFFACTYAYSLLLQSKPDEAAKIVDSFTPDALKNPSIAAYYGVVEAQAGRKSAAKEALKLATTARLLPEEMELVRQAQARL